MAPSMSDPSNKLLIEYQTRIFVGLAGEKGRGVFSAEPIPAGTLVENSIALPISAEESDLMENSVPSLARYLFAWNEEDEKNSAALVTGFASMYNHAAPGNLRIERDLKNSLMSFFAARNIEAGEELTIDYGIPLWFETAR
jgi:uncharacterized protein